MNWTRQKRCWVTRSNFRSRGPWRALGRTIGFPTANIPLRRQVSPVKGVYAVEVAGLGEKPFYGVANIGTRPTVAGVRQQLEVHLLDVVMDLYGRHIDVILRKKYAMNSDSLRWMNLRRKSREMN